MAGPCQITELEIVGYATVLKDTMVPSIVAPIFRRKANPLSILFPPYTFDGGAVWNATEGLPGDLDRLAENHEITRFEAPLPARDDFELWVDEEMAPHYEPRAQVDRKLHSIALENLERAEAAFAEGKQAVADRLCGVALSADDRLVDPLALKAAIRRQQQDSAGERVMAKLASRTLGLPAFERLVRGYVESASGGNYPHDLLRSRPMFGMAAVRLQPA